MNKTQNMKRRPITAMPGHAIALSGLQRAADQQDAHRMGVLMRLRGSHVKPHARMLLLAGLLY